MRKIIAIHAKLLIVNPLMLKSSRKWKWKLKKDSRKWKCKLYNMRKLIDIHAKLLMVNPLMLQSSRNWPRRSWSLSRDRTVLKNCIVYVIGWLRYGLCFQKLIAKVLVNYWWSWWMLAKINFIKTFHLVNLVIFQILNNLSPFLPAESNHLFLPQLCIYFFNF